MTGTVMWLNDLGAVLSIGGFLVSAAGLIVMLVASRVRRPPDWPHPLVRRALRFRFVALGVFFLGVLMEIAACL